MPYIVNGESRLKNRLALESVSGKYPYKYPSGLNLEPKSKLHKDLVDMVMERARLSADRMTRKHSYWKELDRNLTSYVDLTAEEKDLQDTDDRKPVTIVFPYMYAILETLLGYMASAFFQEPIFQYIATNSKSQIGAILMEQVINQHCWRNKVPLALHTMFRDAFVYSFGVAAPRWRTHTGYKTSVEPVFSKFYQLFGIDKQVSERVIRKKTTLFEGNELGNIDPYKCLPDPNVPIEQAQRGEFFGWINSTNYQALLMEEKDSEHMFNVKYLKHLTNRRTSLISDDVSDREKRYGGQLRDMNDGVTHLIDEVNMYVTLVPRDWKIGKNTYPEKWFFRVGADEVLLECRPIGVDHGMYPIAVIAPEFDGYSSTPISRLETLFGMQHVVDFLFNAHIANVRKAINDMFVVDPYLINVSDVRDPKAGKLIRMRRPAWGRGVKDAIAQLNVQDITKQNVSDIAFVVDYMNRVSAVDEAAMGAMRKSGPERLTSAEFQGTRTGAYSRLERIARIIGAQGMQDIGYMFASHTQQLLSNDTFARAVGDNAQILMDEYGVEPGGIIPVSPRDLYIDYDVTVRDGSVPGNNYSKVWENLFKIVASDQELRQIFDITRIFKHIARNNGAKEVNSFVRMRTAPQEQIQQQVQAGNFVPVEGTGM